MAIKYTVDVRGLTCPAPLLKARQGLNEVSIGECIEVLATDKSTVRDFHRMVELTEHKLISFQETEQVYRYVLEKGK